MYSAIFRTAFVDHAFRGLHQSEKSDFFIHISMENLVRSLVNAPFGKIPKFVYTANDLKCLCCQSFDMRCFTLQET